MEYQEQELLLDQEKERLEMAGKPVPENFTKPIVDIPPIPTPPTPPKLSSIDGFEPEAFEDLHPIYLPKTREQTMVAHLDKACFHIVDGRYFGLSSNYVADPNFVGPNAPGLSGLSISGGTGLATANTGGGGASGGTLLSAPSQSGASVNANPNAKTKDTTSTKERGKAKSPGKLKDGNAVDKAKPVSTPGKISSMKDTKPSTSSATATMSSSKKKSNGPAATASASDLRKIIEDGGDEAEKMKTCIIRAAVYASRCGKHTRNYRAPDGKVYPDISKAFAAHAGLKPCERCRNNKQGVSRSNHEVIQGGYTISFPSDATTHCRLTIVDYGENTKNWITMGVIVPGCLHPCSKSRWKSWSFELSSRNLVGVLLHRL